MRWMKRCVMPTLPHEVLAADVIYPIVLLAHDRLLGLLSAMMSCFQSGLRVLTLSFCHVEVMEDEEGNAILDRNGEQKRKILNLHVKLPYTYQRLGMMHCLPSCQRCRSQLRTLFLLSRSLNAWNGKRVTCLLLKAWITIFLDAFWIFQGQLMVNDLSTS